MKYQIAEFLIDTARFRISSGDTHIPAEPKVFDLLVYLVRHRDRVVTREELFQEVWDGREVSDATLSNHIKSARKILGDSGDLQKTIQTSRGRGYQVIPPVTVIPEGGRGATCCTARLAHFRVTPGGGSARTLALRGRSALRRVWRCPRRLAPFRRP